MVKEFNGNVEVHLFLVWPQNYKICFLCVERLCLPLANYIQWQVLYWLLLLASSNSSQLKEGSCHRETDRNTIDRRYH